MVQSPNWQPVHKKTPPPEKRRCHRCHGSGRAPCQVCHGKGQVVVGREANTMPIFGRCEGCMGTKTARCTLCGGERMI